MVELKDKQIFIDGKPKLILAGEIHYFRLAKEDWQDRIDKLKAAGFNTVATYIPWICHEMNRGEFDLDGHTRPELDVEGFIELCAQNDLYFIARPGPFIMAEMKNEGIPSWVIRDYPEIKPLSWDGVRVECNTVDYSNPDFLRCAKNWYAQIMPLLGKHLQPNGGNIIGVQLDNEIGMLSWCANAPDLTETVLDKFEAYLAQTYDGEQLALRYPFDIHERSVFRKSVQSPEETYVLELKKDLGHFMRQRFSDYVDTLRRYAVEFGIKDVPYLINIHGTAGGRGLTYMIGVSQLYKAYTQSDEYFPGSDIYLGALTMDNFQDLYLLNGYMEAVNRKNQPLASFEFECGDANYGETFGSRTDVSGADFKARMCVAQGNKALNCYLFCGGVNYKDSSFDDGNCRIACTGERHGFAAPVSPEGELNYTYDRMARAMKILGASGDKLASMWEERDGLAMGFIPDYYMTEYCYPKSEKEKNIQDNLIRYRGQDGFERFARTLLLDNFRFSAVNIQDSLLNCKYTPVLAVFSASYMDNAVQKKLADYVREGGRLVLYGAVPSMDMEGNPCTVLKDLMGIGAMELYQGRPGFFPALQPVGYIADSAEISVMDAWTFEVNDCTPLLVTADTGKTAAFEKDLGAGKVLVMGTPYICHLENWKRMFASLGCKPELSHDVKYHGLFMTMMKNAEEERFLHILNLDGFEKHACITYKGKVLFDGQKLRIGSKEGLMLPLDMDVDGKRIIYSTAEIAKHSPDSMLLRLTQKSDTIVFGGTGLIVPSENYVLHEENGRTVVQSRIDARAEESFIEIVFA